MQGATDIRSVSVNMKYRKKPVVIDAIQLQVGVQSMSAVQAFTSGTARPEIGGAMLISTLEGNMRADIGDWIIKGVKGEFYPCKNDVFEATYEREDGAPV